MSARLKQELIHPNRSSRLVGVRFSPDGKRLIAGDYPGGVVMVWDVASGKQLTAIQTGYVSPLVSLKYFFLSPDWKTVYVVREKRKGKRVEKDGKRQIHWECEGDVRAWDLSTGELRDTFQHYPPCGCTWMALAPDGATFATFEELSGESDAGPKEGASLWDGRTKQFRPLPAGLSSSVYSPDSKILAAPAVTPDGQATAIKLFDVATAKEKLAIPIGVRGLWAGCIFAPDGKQLVGHVQDRAKTGRQWLKFWDAATGQETASFEGKKKDFFFWMVFSPDGRTLAMTNMGRQHAKLFLFDPIGKRLVKTISLGEATKGEIQYPGEPAFSPDGKWLALITQAHPDKPGQLDAEDLAQPRIQLIDVAAGAIRETLVAPQAQGLTHSACFSPDGRTLATDGQGRVLLWDLAKPPGTSLHASGLADRADPAPRLTAFPGGRSRARSSTAGPRD